MKVWILYDGKSGQCKKLAAVLEDLLEGVHDVRVGIVKKISPLDVVADSPDVVVVGGPLKFGKPSRDISAWIKRLHEITRKTGRPVKKAFAFYTWSRSRNDEPWQQLFQKYSFATNIFPQILAVKIESKAIPLSFEKNAHIYNIIESFQQFLLHEKDTK